MTTFEKLENLTALAKADEELRCGLLATRTESDPYTAFCRLAQAAGVALFVGELFAVGQEYSDNQCKSTNGGNPSPYESFDDTYEIFLAAIA